MRDNARAAGAYRELAALPQGAAAAGPGAGEILVRVKACGVCRTDLHVAEGDLPPKHREIVPGREVVGIVEGLGAGNTRADGEEFLRIAGEIPIRTYTTGMELNQANRALQMLKHDELRGAAVLHVS